jgi:outer membrane murein-binding lipoprotein Lpp
MFQYLIVLLITIEILNADGKRLLLTDPDAVAQRLSQLESTVQQLSSTVHQLSNNVKIQSTTIQQLQQPSSATESMLRARFLLVNDNVRSIEINFVVSFSFFLKITTSRMGPP